MLAVGILTAIGLWSADLPAALAVGVLAGGLSFVLYIGPIAAAVPALLIALPTWPRGPLWVLVIYTGVQFLEGNVITPFVENRAVSLPPSGRLAPSLAPERITVRLRLTSKPAGRRLRCRCNRW